jgi:hypothetical protein
VTGGGQQSGTGRRSTPILHFHGHFRFHMPEYNNDPTNPGVRFDPNIDARDVRGLCGCDPARYYEFSFYDARVTQITHAGAESVTAGDPVIGRSVELSGFLPDVSPSAIGAQLYAARLRVDRLVAATLQKATQSDLRLNIRPLGFTDETAGAHFSTAADVGQWLDPGGSRAFAELRDIRELEVAFHLNHYTRLDHPGGPAEAKLTGDVYGYLRPRAFAGDAEGTPRHMGRRLVAHPRLAESPALERIFLRSTGGTPFMRITDIDGTYDLLLEDRMIVLRQLDFVPLLDRDYTTPTSANVVDHYVVSFEGAGTAREVGRFRGDHAEMMRSGGLLAFPLAEEVTDYEGLVLSVAAAKEGSTQPVMLESEWDLVLETDRGVKLSSGSTAEVVARVYRRQRPVAGHPVRLRTQEVNRRSPIVARLEGAEASTDEAGRVTVTVRAVDLAAADGLLDPVTQQPYDQLPWDRYYGNYVYLSIDNPLRRTDPPVEEAEIAVRVVHSAPEPTGAPSFERDVRPLFSYYVRYLPWLHTIQSGDRYTQFLDLADYESFSERAQEIIRRLELDDDRPEKMPRSRDFPAGGADAIKRWYDAGMSE